MAVAVQIAKEGAGGVGDDPVDAGAGGAGLNDLGGVARTNGEALPVDCGMAGACAVGGGDHQFVGLGGGQRGGAMDGDGTRGQDLAIGRCEGKSGG